MSMLSYDQQKSLRELFIVLEKGIDLLANENLDKDLYEAFEKYANSTIKMVDEAYNGGYMSYFSNPFMPHNYFNQPNPINYTGMSMSHSAMGAYNLTKQSSEYRNKLKDLLKQLILLAQKVVYE